MKRVLLLGLFAAAIIVAVILTGSCRRINPCTANKGDCYSIQGEGSQPGCPGQHTTTVEIDEHSFFLECY